MTLPETEREALAAVMRQTESDLRSAHAEICKLQNLDPATHTWPAWTPQANTLRWIAEMRAKFFPEPTPSQPELIARYEKALDYIADQIDNEHADLDDVIAVAAKARKCP